MTRLHHFIAGDEGEWSIERIEPCIGETLPAAPRLAVLGDGGLPPARSAWALRGVTSNDRYVERSEKSALAASQAGLGRPEATFAALIPIRKCAAWWALTQEERRAVFEAQSRHIGIGLKFLPAVARRLHHCRDLGTDEPFDFLTWFDYAPAHEPAFDELLRQLRASPEWSFVEREVDIRVRRSPG